MNLMQIFKEIKIQNPVNQIRLTEKGKQAVNDIRTLRRILKDLTGESAFQEVFDDRYQTEELIMADFLTIFVDEEVISENKVTSLEDYYKRMSEFWDSDRNNLNFYLEQFSECKYIHPIKI